jgi:hypothetical protein
MRIPFWLTIAAAVLVIGFGAFRIYVAFKKPDADAPPRRGFHRMSPRMHGMIGVMYLLLGAALSATSFGWTPFGNLFAVESKKPAKDEAPTTTPLPKDQLPSTKM